MLDEIDNKSCVEPQRLATENAVRSLCLAIQSCKNLVALTDVVVKGVSSIYKSAEISWLEVDKAEGKLLWSSIHSDSDIPSSHDKLGGATEINALRRVIKRYREEECDDIILLSEIASQSELAKTAYFQHGMEPAGLRDTINLQAYNSESGAVILTLGMKQQGLAADDRKDLAYIRDHIRAAAKKIAQMRSCSNLIKTLQETRKTKQVTGVSVISSDGAKLWDVDKTSELILGRTRLGEKIEGRWALKDELSLWVENMVKNDARIFPREIAYTQKFGTKGCELEAAVYLERAGAGGLLICSSENSPYQKLNEEQKSRFTRRESEIATLMLADESSQEISDALTISKRTVEKHLENIYIKLEVKNRLAAIKKLRAAS